MRNGIHLLSEKECEIRMKFGDLPEVLRQT